jgi:hypothetical protein
VTSRKPSAASDVSSPPTTSCKPATSKNSSAASVGRKGSGGNAYAAWEAKYGPKALQQQLYERDYSRGYQRVLDAPPRY